MFVLIYFISLNYVSGSIDSFTKQLTFLPKVSTPNKDDIQSNAAYCLRTTWLGMKYDETTFYQVENKTCKDMFSPKTMPLCIDPMTVTRKGKKPDIDYILDHYPKVAVCKLSDDQVCAKYTVYYNGIVSEVTRYCTRIDIESGGQMKSGCVVEKKGGYTHELCACRSELGRDGICNASPELAPLRLLLSAALIIGAAICFMP